MDSLLCSATGAEISTTKQTSLLHKILHIREKKRQTLKYFMFSDGTFHLPRGACHTCWWCFGGLCSGTPLHGLENAPSAPEWHKFGYCWPELHSDPELWPQLAFLQQQPGDFLSFVLTWDVAVLHQTCGRYRIKNNTRILGVLGGFFLDILEYIIYIKNISRKRGAGQPACCTLQSIYLISIFWKKKCFKLFTNLPLVGGKRRETQGIKN